MQLQWDDIIPVIDRDAAFSFSNELLQFQNRGSDVQKNVAIRAGTSLNLVLKFQVDRACFHREAHAAKGEKVE